MKMEKYLPGKVPISVHQEVCSFLYEGRGDDLMRHLAISDYTTIFAFKKDNVLVGTVQCIWKRDWINLPIEEGMINGLRVRLPRPAVEIAGLKLSLPAGKVIDFLPVIYKLLLEETSNHTMYVTCSKDMENLYTRRFMFKPFGEVTYNNRDWFVAMKRDPQ